MKRTISTGPKRLRWRRRDWSGAGGIGQERRWGSTVGNFKAEREARRAGLTGKRGKHRGQGADPAEFNPAHAAVYALMAYEQMVLWANVTDPSRERATGEREADSDSLASQREEEREEE